MEKLENLAREALVARPLVEGRALQVYAIACRYRLGKEARTAARHAMRQPFQEWHCGAELETISGEDYYRLRKYHLECFEAATTKFQRQEPADYSGCRCNDIQSSQVAMAVYPNSSCRWSAGRNTADDVSAENLSRNTSLDSDWWKLTSGVTLPCSSEASTQPFPESAAIERAVSGVNIYADLPSPLTELRLRVGKT